MVIMSDVGGPHMSTVTKGFSPTDIVVREIMIKSAV
jgi:hypothetical protein